jgi:hypothetical protein
MCVESYVAPTASTSPIFVPELKRSFLGGKSRTSITPIVHRSAAPPMTPLHPTLMEPLVISVGDPIKVPLTSSWPAVVHQEALMVGELVEEMCNTVFFAKE